MISTAGVRWIVVATFVVILHHHRTATSFQIQTITTTTRVQHSRNRRQQQQQRTLPVSNEVSTVYDGSATSLSATQEKAFISPSSAAAAANAASTTTNTILDGFWKSMESLMTTMTTKTSFSSSPSPGAAFLQAVFVDQDIDRAMSLVNETVEFFDTAYPSPLDRAQLERHLRLQQALFRKTTTAFVLEHDICNGGGGKAGVVFGLDNKKSAALFQLTADGLIYKAFYVQENQKQGAINLQILKLASDIIGSGMSSPLAMSNDSSEEVGRKKSLPEQYFDAWNQRDMKRATAIFSADIEYDDTAFPEPFQGQAALEKHLNLCAEALPEGFSFILDDKLDVGNHVMVQWHVENDGKELPFTKGCSFYEIAQGKIIRGTDWKEPAVFKTAGLNLLAASFLSNIQREPARLIPVVTWIAYCYVVFFSDWFYGVPAQAVEQRTWEEVRDLSLNFFLVSPILGLPFSPVVHPGLEGIFNFLLSWAALFAGFLSDDRPKKPNPLPMLPTVIGMQFLTSAFLLPYLATRSTETEANVSKEDLTVVSQVTESPLLGPAMGVVGTGSILWGLFARTEFGGFSERLDSLGDLLSMDRVGSSFLVDLAIFGLFQGWLVDDDLRRRDVNSDAADALFLYKAVKYIPFFGMVTYLTLRPSYPSGSEE